MADTLDVQELRTIFSANTKQLEGALIRHGNRVEAAALRQEKAFRESNARIARSTKRMADDVRTAIAGVGVGLAVRETVQLADAWTLARNKIAAATEISGLQARSLNDIAAGAIEARAEFVPYVDLYARILRASKGVADSEAEVARATNVVAKAFKAGGAAASEQAAGITQLGQALGSGFLQGDELRSLRENAPVVLQALADEFNTTLGGLKELGAQGELTSEKFFRALLKAEEGVNRAFAQTIPTVSDSFAILTTRIGEFINAENQASGATATLSQIILFVAENVDTLAAAITVAGAALIGFFGASATASVVKGLQSATKGAQGLTAALAILNGVAKGFGGPLVLAATAVSAALALILINAEKAEPAVDRLNRRTSEIEESLREIGEQAGVSFDDMRTGAEDALPPIDELARKYRELRKDMEASGAAAKQFAIDSAATNVIELANEVELARQKIVELETLASSPVTAFGGAQTARDAEAKLAELRPALAEAEQRLEEAKRFRDELLRVPREQFKVGTTTDAEAVGGDKDANKAANAAVDELRKAYLELGQTERDVINEAYRARVAAIEKTVKDEGERARLIEQAYEVRSAAIDEVDAKEQEVAAERKADAEEELSDQRKLVNEVLDSRDQMYGRISSLAEADYRRRRELLIAEIEDQKLLNQALAALDAEQAERRRELERQALGIGEGDDFQAEIERIRLAEADKYRVLEDWAATQLDLAEDNVARQLEIEEAYQRRRTEIEAETNQQIADARTAQAQAILGAYENAAGGIASALASAGKEESKAYRAAVAAQKGFAVASSLIAISQATAQALADPSKVTTEQKLIAYATIAAQGAQILATLSDSGYRKGGHTGYGADGEPAGTVHRNEWVHSGSNTRRIGVSNLKALDEGRAIIVRRPGYREGGLVGSMPPVTAQGLQTLAMPQVNVTMPEIRVINNAPGVAVEQSRNAAGEMELVVRAVRREMVDDFRSGGPVSKAAGGAFGMKRAPTS